jgi:hypothetical protein
LKSSASEGHAAMIFFSPRYKCINVVPKAGSVFILQAYCWKVTLIGDKLSPNEKLKEDQRQQRAQSQIR